jgi:alpha-L-fucosidase 2
MLLQSQNGVVELLPALPPAWAQGEVKGLVARGDFVVSFNWQQHRVQQVSVTARKGGTCLMKVNGKVHTLYLQPGEKKSWKEL